MKNINARGEATSRSHRTDVVIFTPIMSTAVRGIEGSLKGELKGNKRGMRIPRDEGCVVLSYDGDDTFGKRLRIGKVSPIY